MSIPNPVSFKLDVNQEVRFFLCPARLSVELRSEMESLTRSREAVKNRIQELCSRPGEVVRDELASWIDAVDRLEGEVFDLVVSLNYHTPCFRFVCCCSYPQNFTLGQQVGEKLGVSRRLKAEYDGWNGVLSRRTEPLRSPRKAMGDELNELEALRMDLDKMAEDEIRKAAELKQKSHALTDWCRKADQLVEEVREYTNQLVEEQEGFEKISQIRAEIKNLRMDGEKYRSLDKGCLVVSADPDRIPDLAGSLPSFLVGIEDDVSKIFGYLDDDRTSVIGIHGMGGAGKTTLVKEVVRRLRLPEKQAEFDLVAFVEVSQTPNILKIQAQIGARLGYSWSSTIAGNATDIHQERLEILSKRLFGKRFLLILDDVWKGLDLQRIGIPPLGSGGTNSKVLMTTRELKVCDDMDCKVKLHVGRLDKDDSRKLFYHMCSKDDGFFRTEKEICEIIDNILSKCGGLPLVIKTIARALANTSTLKDWRHANLLLDCFPNRFVEEMETVFKQLKFSFDHLKSDQHRSCLLSFALYPKDEEININEIIRYWIGEGLLESTRRCKLEKLEARGRFIIKTLQNACLLEKGFDDDHVKMHDTIRDMAIWLGSKESDYKQHKFLPYESWYRMTEQPEIDDNWNDVERICFRGMRKITISDGVFAFVSLRTLLFREAYLVEIPEKLFAFTPNLHVLDLSWNNKLQTLPESLWSLKSLRYLDLSDTRIEQIPQRIGSLASLQFLYLRETNNIKQIPLEVGQLTNLMVLDLWGNQNVSGIPYSSMATLSKLQVLDLQGTSLSSSDGGTIKGLDNLVPLSSLSLTLHTLEDVKEIRECDVLKKSIRRLEIKYVEKLSVADVSSVLLGLSGLQLLHIVHCPGLKGTLQLPSHSLQKLEELLLINSPLLSCFAVESQCKQLSSLVTLNIHSCDQLRDLRCLLQLPNLEALGVFECKGMVELIPSEEEAAAAAAAAAYSFPKLKRITLHALPCLESISKVPLHLSSLKDMFVNDCPKLRKLGVIESEKAVTIECEKQCWEQLQWEDAARLARPDNFQFKAFPW